MLRMAKTLDAGGAHVCAAKGLDMPEVVRVDYQRGKGEAGTFDW